MSPCQTLCRRWDRTHPRPTSGTTAQQATATAPAGTATITSIVCHQFSKIPLKTTTFTGVLRATEFPT